MRRKNSSFEENESNKPKIEHIAQQPSSPITYAKYSYLNVV